MYDLSALQFEIEKNFKITTTQFAAILTSFYVSNIATCMLASWFAEQYGRRLAMFVMYSINIVAYVLNLISYYTLYYPYLLTARIVSG